MMGTEASLQLLRALRAIRRGAGSAALEELGHLLDEAVESSLQESGDEGLESAFAAELIRVLGPELGEETPTTLQEAAVYLADRRDGFVTRRPPLLPLLKQLTELSTALKAAESGPVLSSESLDLITQAQQTVDLARARANIPASFEPARSASRADPLAALAKLEERLHFSMERLVSELNRLYQPLTIATDEAVAVARFALGGPRPQRRKAMLALAGSLDALCKRAPLNPEDLERLRALAQEADLEREEEGWRALADRLWLLRARLIGSKNSDLPPIYRGHSQTEERRPNSLEAMICT